MDENPRKNGIENRNSILHTLDSYGMISFLPPPRMISVAPAKVNRSERTTARYVCSLSQIKPITKPIRGEQFAMHDIKVRE